MDEHYWTLFQATGLPELWLLGRLEGRHDDIGGTRDGSDHQCAGAPGGQLQGIG